MSSGLSPKGTPAGVPPPPQATNSSFITNFADDPKKICIKDPSAQGSSKHHGAIYFSFDRVFWTDCSQEEVFQVFSLTDGDSSVRGSPMGLFSGREHTVGDKTRLSLPCQIGLTGAAFFWFLVPTSRAPKYPRKIGERSTKMTSVYNDGK